MVDDRLRLLEHEAQVIRAPEAFGIDLVDVLGARRACGEPGACGLDFYAVEIVRQPQRPYSISCSAFSCSIICSIICCIMSIRDSADF